MSTETKQYQRKLSELVVEPTNDWPAWSSKCQVQLEAWKQWSHIVGLKAKAPEVPTLVLPYEATEIGQDGSEVTVMKAGNEAEYKLATENHQKWKDADLEVKALLFMAVPSSHYQYVHPCKTAAQTWDTLRIIFGSVNAEKAIALKRKISLAMCKPGENVKKWCIKQHRRYIELGRMDPNKMSEREFCEIILDQQDRSDRNWASRVNAIRDMVKEYLAKYKLYPSSILVTQWLKHEYWALFSGELEDSDGEDEDQGAELNANTANYPSSSYNGNGKRPRSDADHQSDLNRDGKRQNKGPKRTDVCTNTYCKRTGHPTDECFSYGGPKQGQYPWWWRGPWNLHIHPSKRTAANNIRPPPQAEGRNGVISATPSRSLANRISTEAGTEADVHQTLNSNFTNQDSRAYYATDSVHQYSANNVELTGGINVNERLPGVYTESGIPELIKCNASALDASRPILEVCIHDSGANRHVFHSRDSFKHYKEIEPVKVNGFGKDLNTCAVGIGTVYVEAWREGKPKVLYELTNCIHVPSARYNLISQAQLDQAGVEAVVGNSKITLHKQGLILLDGVLSSNLMYQLNMWPVTQIVDDNRQLEALVNAFTLDTMDDFLQNDKVKLKEDFTTASLGI